MRQVLLLCITLLLPFAAVAQGDSNILKGIEINGIYYNLNTYNQKAEVMTGADKTRVYITIPTTVTYEGKNYIVRTIGLGAFNNFSSLAGITLPETLESIGENAFSNCKKLNNVSIPAHVKTVENYAFSGCSGLTKLTLNYGLVSIGKRAFASAPIESLNIPTSVTSIDDYAFSGAHLTQLDIPYTLTYISPCAFQCTTLKTIRVASGNPVYDSRDNCNAVIESARNALRVICPATKVPETVEVIDSFLCWRGCSITPTSSIKEIGKKAYYAAYGIRTLHEGLEVIGDSAFWAASIQGTVSLPSTLKKVGVGVYEANNLITEVVMADGLKVLGKAMFRGNQWIPSVKFPEGITEIPDEIFSASISLADVQLPSTLQRIGNSAFRGCALTNVQLPDGLTTIDEYAFSGCQSLTHLEIPATVTSIGKGAFASTHLTRTNLPDGITSVSAYLYNSCTSLTIIDLPTSVTCIGSDAFANCKGLTKLEIPNHVTDFENGAFNDCSSVTTLSIGNNVKTIGNNSFGGMKALTDVYCYSENVPETSYWAFEDSHHRSLTLHVPASSVEAYKAASPWKEFREIVPLTDEEYPLGIRQPGSASQVRVSYTLDGRKATPNDRSIIITRQGNTAVKHINGSVGKTFVK